MKKFYAFLMAVLVAAMAFAQGQKGGKSLRVPTTLPLGKNIVARHTPKKGVKAKVRKYAEDAASYVKVNTAPEDWEGQYLIVYEDGNVAMNGGLTEKLDAVENTISVTISDGEIASTSATDAASFVIKKTDGGYSIQSASGLYMGKTTDANGLDSGSSSYDNTLSIDGEGNADILSSGGAYLRFNSASNQLRFRYYKSSTYTNQKAIQLYKLGGEKTEPASGGSGELVELPEGVETEEWNMAGTMYVWDGEDWQADALPSIAPVAIDGEDIYVQGLSYWFEEAWVKGTISGSKALFPSNQFMGSDEYGDDYIVAYDNETYDPTDYLEFDFDTETGTLTMTNWYGESDAMNSTGVYNYCEELTISQNAIAGDEVVTVPEGLVTTQYNLTAQSLDYDDDNNEELTPVAGITYVGFDGDDVYIQGLCAYITDAWVKGTRSGSTIIIPAGQYYGAYETFFGDFDMYFGGCDEEGNLLDVHFSISDDEKTLTAQEWVITNSEKDEAAPYEILTALVLTKAVEKEATPANPSVSDFSDYDAEDGYGMVVVEIPTTDTNGEPMLVDKLSYVLYVDENGTISPYTFDASLYEVLTESISEVPFTLDDDWDFDVDGEMVWISLNSETATYTRIGVQSIYRGMGIEHKSDIVWYTIDRDGTAIKGVSTDEGKSTVYNLAGQRVEKAQKGIYIVNGKKVVKR